MKLCPQCEFIYEDDQNVCDMDGKELVFESRPPAAEDNILFQPQELHEPAAVAANSAPSVVISRSKASWSGGTFAFLAAILLIVLLFAVFFARSHRAGDPSQASNQPPVQVSNESNQPVPAEQPASDKAAESSAPDVTADEQPASESAPASAEPPTPIGGSSTALSRGRIAATVGADANGHGPVILRLTNGASIKADEAWERKDGIWYRQGGMITMLPRNRVRSIQRVSPPASRVIAASAEARNRKPENAAPATQVRIQKVNAANEKKGSRVSSFLKRTGQILSKPFKF